MDEMMEALFDKKYICELCQKEFTNKKVKRGSIKVKNVDTDFYTEYEGENPSYYLVKVCPHCGYCMSEFSSPLKSAELDSLKAFLKENPPNDSFSGARDAEKAEKVFLYALKVAEWRREKPQTLGNFCLQLSWVYRFLNKGEKEKEYLEKALEHFLNFYQTADRIVNLGKTMFVLGELCRRLGKKNEALNWYARIIGDEKVTDQTIIRMARKQWQELRRQ
jgi:uncharacterized protein (DUF2225 family)